MILNNNSYICTTMKKLIILLLLISNISVAQEKKNKDRIKIGLTGAFIVGGSLVTVAKIYTKEPVYDPNKDVEIYISDKKAYDKAQKNLSLTSSILYGLSGISLISIRFDF